MKQVLLTGILAVTLACGTGTLALAAEAAPKAAAEAGAAADGKFIEAAAQGGMTEIAASQLAEDRTKNKEVKYFAEMMIKDHKDVAKNLKSVTDKMNIALPGEMNAEQKASIAKLQGVGEPDFDRMYASMMLADHKKMVGLFEGFAKTASHADLKAFASNTLPGLKTHLKHAEDLTKALGVKE
jgi:putative membrane protein